ncbi:MAG: amino acid adenylation domain-containing protein, partial [Christensenella sp.]
MKPFSEHSATKGSIHDAMQLPLSQERESWPLTPAEQGILVEYQLEPKSLAYNAGLAFELKGVVDVPLLEKSLDSMVQRHRILRSYYSFNDGEFAHCIAPQVKVRLTRVRCAYEEIRQKMDERNVPFDIGKAPLYRFVLYETDKASILHISFHHTILDGVSIAIFMDELWKTYQGETLTNARPDYLDLAVHQIGTDYAPHASFFDEMFSDGIPETEMPTCPLRPGVLPYTDTKIGIELPSEMITAAAHKLGITTYTLLFAAIGMVLGKYCGSEDVIVGTAVNGRAHAASRDMLGMFVNSLPVRLKPEAGKTFEEYALLTAQTLKDVKRHQDYPFEKLVSRFAPERNASRAPLFDVIVNYLHEIPTMQVGELRISPFRVRRQALAYDFQIEIRKDEQKLAIDLSYAQALYEDEVAFNFLEQLQTTLKRVCKNPSLPLIDAIELPERQTQQIISDFAGEQTDGDINETVVSLIRKQAARTPEHPAVRAGECTLTYAQLDEQTNRLAAEICRRGIHGGDCVGVMVGRTKMMPICAVGVLKSGAAYLPMDPSYPSERLEYMLSDAGVKLILADRELAGCVPGFTGEFLYTEDIDTLPRASALPQEPQPDDLMVLLYTSGTTGNPKGVMLCHNNLTHFCAWYRRTYQLTENDGVSAYASFGFDACLMDMYPTLTAGAQLHIIPAEMRLDIEGINEYIEKNNITVAFFTTQLGRQFAECMENKSLRALSVGGEALVPIEPPKDFLLSNLYGPTECTVLVTRFCVDKLYDRVPIGAAIDNTRLYVLDRHDRLAPVGVAGELCIAGRGVAKGYLNRPDLTEEKFTPNPFTQETQYARIYRSGDVVRFLPSGTIDFVGRRDFQIKIRGFRVELTEIEGRIREYPAVTNAAVVPMDAPGGGKCAVAYIVSGEAVQTEQLNQFIEEVLPPYMVPTATMQVEFIPLNPNGKVDRRKLPPPVFGNAQQESGGFAQTELGKGIAEIVAGILGHSGFDATENLLRAGVTSLSAIKLATQIEKRFHVSLPVKNILAECTVLALENMVVSSLLTRDSQAAAQEIDLGPIKLEKIDLSVVTDPQTLRADERTEHIRAVLTEVLGDLQAGNTDDLTRAGLTSLSTIKLVTRLKKHFGVAPTVHELLERATVKTIEEALLRASAQKAEQGEEIEEQAGYPLSGSQLGVYLDCLKRPDALLYNIPIRVDMPEGVEAQRLKQAAQTVIDAHPILKMHIADDAEEIQQIPSDEPARVALLEMTKEELAAHAAAFIQPFNLAKGPLYRVEIISCDKKLSMLADFHHIVFDGASLDLFLHELAAAYDGQTLEKEQISGFHAALLEQRREGSEQWQADKDYFDGCLKVVEGASEIAGDLSNPSGRVGSMRDAAKTVQRDKVEDFCRKNGYTPAGLFFAAAAYTVSRWTRNEIAALSTVSSGRSDLRLQNSVGMFVRTLPLVLA